MINKNSPLPIYYQIEELIKQQITSKDLTSGDCLPSEREYAEKFNISRMTVRQAITNLVNSGYLHRVKGKGTFVADQSVVEQQLQGVTSFTEEMVARGKNPSSSILKFEKIPANKEIARKLNINEDDLVYEIERLRLADNIPMALESSYHPVNLFKDLTEKIASRSIYRYVEEDLGQKIDYSTQSIEASSTGNRESILLNIKEGSPILLMERIAYLTNEVPLEVVRSRYRADRYKFVIKMNR
jgi:GntR family transcriptional regulator